MCVFFFFFKMKTNEWKEERLETIEVADPSRRMAYWKYMFNTVDH